MIYWGLFKWFSLFCNFNNYHLYTCTNKQANIHDNILLMNYYCWMPLSILFQWNHDCHGGGNHSVLKKPPTCSISGSDELTTSVVITTDCIPVGRLTSKSNYQTTMATTEIIFVYRCFYHYIVSCVNWKRNKGNAKHGISPCLKIWPGDLDLWPDLENQ